MEAVREEETDHVVLAGSWNPRIFTPQWMGSGRLTTSQEIGIQFAMRNAIVGLRFVLDDIRLAVSEQRLGFQATNSDTKGLIRAESSAIKVLSDLPHTPLEAVGINHNFAIPEPSRKLVGYFDLADNPVLSDADYTINETVIVRTIAQPQGDLNLRLALTKQGKVRILLNFNLSTNDSNAAKEFIEGGMKRTISEVAKVLEAYEVNWTPEEF